MASNEILQSVELGSGIKRLLTDSRSLEIPEETAFFAIATTGNDGHRYIPELYSRGVREFIVNRIPEGDFPGAKFHQVSDTVKALQQVARRRPDFRGEILAITGSRGKTTLKEWIYQLLEPLKSLARSPRSYNSQIGVPLSMWEIPADSDLAIIEAGISKKGEMQALAECIKPDTVIITNIGDAHSSGFSSDMEKAREKAELARDAGTVIYSSDNSIVADAVNTVSAGSEKLTWTIHDNPADIKINIEVDGNTTKVEYRYKNIEGKFEAPLNSDADKENACHALAFMLHEGIAPDTIAARFARLHKIGTRLNVTEGVNGCSVIHDQYTSDFSSLRPALDFLRRRTTPDQSETLVMSDPHHESSASEKPYSELANTISAAGVTRLVGVGANMMLHRADFEAMIPKVEIYDTVESLLEAVSPSDFNFEAVLVKGSPEYDLDPVAAMLETRRHETVLEVNLDSLVRNYNYFRRQLPVTTGIVCMVKASGYGAGSYEIAKTLQDAGASYLAVAVLDEGIELRQKGITMPIMVMNPKTANYKAMFANKLEPEIYSFEMLRDVIREARRSGITDYPIHIKLDTGMHRMGFIGEELEELMIRLGESKEVTARSVFSHLATADCPDMDDYTELQFKRFAEYTDYMLANYRQPILRHILNSAGILRFPQYHYDMARLGIGLYGANTLPPEIEQPLATVSALRTVIIAIRKYEAGQTIGYGRRGVLTRPSEIATIPVGYADGMNRHFGGGAISVKVNGHDAPTVGNICMDACMIDVTGLGCHVGDQVEVFGPEAPLQRLADALGTIPYEVLTSISPRVKRIYYRE
ncbi:MAG: bifunctional UDP-N-acetylmuramoyl-tripeptide:D-alanyl-D-alanine ligase/alanine racemase [Muribaculaceae bacterium]|nr:bifunctional UDP-N-acetylmuramoyl-tripeptide:D-alanyl-D-alanine ligase/alanine racemase [Muribaculaceae bacterium]